MLQVIGPVVVVGTVVVVLVVTVVGTGTVVGFVEVVVEFAKGVDFAEFRVLFMRATVELSTSKSGRVSLDFEIKAVKMTKLQQKYINLHQFVSTVLFYFPCLCFFKV